MSILHTPLFASPIPATMGVGYHNVGDVLRATHEDMIRQVQRHYGERCGHLPLNAGHIYALVQQHTPDIRTQMSYLSQLFGRTITPLTLDELKAEKERMAEPAPLVVPYINVPETATRLGDALDTQVWGLPAKMTHVLKNKASFYQLAEEFELEGFYPPDYTIADLHDLPKTAKQFLARIEDIYKRAGIAQSYPPGVVLRAAESDGNYGCCLVYENGRGIALVPHGDAELTQYYTSWREALASSQEHLLASVDMQKEARIVISRYIDFVDSPGMSVVILEDQVVSLGWNGQLQKEGSKACVGTSTYLPKTPHLQRMQQQYEEQTAAFFEAFLRKAARKCGIDFASIRGLANIDIIIPGELEQRLQQSRKRPMVHYLAECNPRWTNYTDAIMAVLGANRKEQTIANMQAVIREGICTFDKYPLPAQLDPRLVRECLAERDAVLQRNGTRMICRMAKNPMGLIFAGDVRRAEEEMQGILAGIPNH